LRPGQPTLDGVALCDYGDALALMDALVARGPDAPDFLLSVQHPPTITLGRRGGREHVLGTELAGHGEVAVHEVARGGSATWHAPGQLVVYPVVQLARMQGPVGVGPLGDLPAFVRLLEAAVQATCAAFGVQTIVRSGFSGVWLDAGRKLASIGVGMRGGWTFHGLALNVTSQPEGFGLVTPCGLGGVQLTTLSQAAADLGLSQPGLAAVEAELVEALRGRLARRD